MVVAMTWSETLVRLSAFIGVFGLMAFWEIWAPRRPQAIGRLSRWPGNLGIVALNALLLRLVFPITAVAWASVVQQHGYGALWLWQPPALLHVVLAVMALDLAIYLQHLLFHSVPALWRLHRMHHADTEFDVTNGLRFHPLEILLSMAIKFAVIALIGAPAMAVLVFEVLLNATSIFNHGNVRLATGLDRLLRRVVVTPDMHRVHHSVLPSETHSNFGFNLPWWDHLFKTYRAQPRLGHEQMQLGLPIFRDPRWLRLDRLLWLPWAGDAGPTRRDLRADRRVDPRPDDGGA